MVTTQGKNSVIKFRMWISIKKHLILLGVDLDAMRLTYAQMNMAIQILSGTA